MCLCMVLSISKTFSYAQSYNYLPCLNSKCFKWWKKIRCVPDTNENSGPWKPCHNWFQYSVMIIFLLSDSWDCVRLFVTFKSLGIFQLSFYSELLSVFTCTKVTMLLENHVYMHLISLPSLFHTDLYFSDRKHCFMTCRVREEKWLEKPQVTYSTNCLNKIKKSPVESLGLCN